MRFPYGIADFAAIMEEGYFYVDRTDRIPLIENAGKQLLFLRPRRFGKSLWLSTLENYYDLARVDDFERLFGGLLYTPTPNVATTACSLTTEVRSALASREAKRPSPKRSAMRAATAP